MLTLSRKQSDRLRYVAACGPVFRESGDEPLERLRLVRPFRGMPSFIEATEHAGEAPDGEGTDDESQTAEELLAACQLALVTVGKSRWCHLRYGCDHCAGCEHYHRVADTVARAMQQRMEQEQGAFAKPR
jgi:hypothetical protein